MELQGRIKLISITQSFGTNSFKKREVVITTEEQYPQMIIFEFHQDKCGLLDNFRIGQLVKISFNVRGREWINPQGEVKYFNSLQGWRIENMEIVQQHPYQQSNYETHQFTNQTTSPIPKQGEMFDNFGNTPSASFPMMDSSQQGENFDDLPF